MKYFYEVYHPKCSRVAFYVKNKPKTDECFLLSDILLKNGCKPKTIDDVCCGACGDEIHIYEKCVRRRLHA